MPTANCPECDEEVYVDADSEQGDTVSCDECGASLSVVGLDQIELDLREEDDGDDYDDRTAKTDDHADARLQCAGRPELFDHLEHDQRHFGSDLWSGAG